METRKSQNSKAKIPRAGIAAVFLETLSQKEQSTNPVPGEPSTNFMIILKSCSKTIKS